MPSLTGHTVNKAIEQFLSAQLPAVAPVEAFILISALSLILAKVIQEIGSWALPRLFARTSGDLDNIVFQHLHAPLYITVAVVGIYIATFSLNLSTRVDFWVRAIALTLITAIWGWALIRVGNRFFAHMKESGERYEFAPIFENIWTFVVVIIALFTLLSIWRVDITPLLASAGVAGVVIGFAAKDAVANLFGGIALYFDNTYKVGDYIVLDSGDAGTVVDIGIRSTTVITRDEVMVTVPNAVLNSSKVVNESSPKTRKRIGVPIGIAYGTDIDVFEELILQIAEDEERVLEHPSPRMRFDGFGDSALQYELLCWVDAPLQDRKARHNLNRVIYKSLNREGIEIPYPKRDVYMRQEAAEEARKEEQEDGGA